MNEVQIPLKLTGIGAIKKELRDLKGQIADSTDPEQMTKLAQRAGELADQLKDANEQVAIFNSGSRFEAASNAFGMIKQDLMSLDFEGAAQKAKVFQTAMAGISGKDITGAFKGLISTVTTLGQTFVRFGLMLLTNPIFLLVAAIVAIVTAVVLFMKKLGILQKVLEVLMMPINALIEGFKALTDWLGFTDHAGAKAAENEKKRNEERLAQMEKMQAERKKNFDAEQSEFDRRIKLMAAEGKSTEELSKQKIQASIDYQKQLVAEQKNIVDNQYKVEEMLRRNGLMTAAGTKLKELEEEANNNLYQSQQSLLNAENDLAVAEAESAKRAKEDAKKKADVYKEYLKIRQDIARQIKDLEISQIKDETERALAENETKYKRLIYDTQKNEKLTADEKKRLTELYGQIQIEEEKKIQQKAKDEQLKQATELANGLNAVTKERTDKKLASDLAEIQSQKEKAEKLKEYNDALIESEKGLFDARLGFAKGLISGLTELAGENKKIANALFLVDKALAIGEIIVNTQREISGYWSNPTWKLLPDGGTALATSASTAAKIRAATSIASIAASTISKFIGGGGGSIPSGGGSAPTATATAQATPAVNLFGQGNQLNQVGAPTSVETNQNITVQAVVSETDVTTTQTKIDKIKKNAEL